MGGPSALLALPAVLADFCLALRVFVVQHLQILAHLPLLAILHPNWLAQPLVSRILVLGVALPPLPPFRFVQPSLPFDQPLHQWRFQIPRFGPLRSPIHRCLATGVPIAFHQTILLIPWPSLELYLH